MTNSNCSTCSSWQYCDKAYKTNSMNKMSQQHDTSLRLQSWRFEIPLRAPVEATNSQAWPIPKLNADKLKYWKVKVHSFTPLSIEPKTSTSILRTSETSTFLFKWILELFLEVPTCALPHTGKFWDQYIEIFTETWMGYIYAKDLKHSRSIKLAIFMESA